VANIRLAHFENYALKRVRVPDSLERNGLLGGKNDVCNANNEYPCLRVAHRRRPLPMHRVNARTCAIIIVIETV